MTDHFLFLDFETTALDPHNLTVLEVGWSVLDANLRQLTPLRSRLAQIATGGPVISPVGPQLDGFRWSHPLNPVVQDMHRDSGLHTALLKASPGSVLRRVEELDRLILDDLVRAGWKTEDTVFLAGSGVGHFDVDVLGGMGSRLTGSHWAVQEGAILHYRAADVSSALTVLGVPAPKTVEDLDRLMRFAVERSDGPAMYQGFRNLITDASTEHLTAWDDEQSGQLNLDQVVAHRAASDVAWSIALARTLRALLTVPEKLPV